MGAREAEGGVGQTPGGQKRPQRIQVPWETDRGGESKGQSGLEDPAEAGGGEGRVITKQNKKELDVRALSSLWGAFCCGGN